MNTRNTKVKFIPCEMKGANKMILAGKELTQIKASQIPEVLAGGDNILIFGPSGWGKTQSIKAFAKATGKKLKIISLASKLPEAIGGIPCVTDKEYYIELLSIELREVFENDGDGWIIFFDEINQACAEVLNTLYGICYPFGEDRAWAGHSLSKAQIVAAGNLMDGRDLTVYLTELPTPLVKRFFPFELVPSKADAKEHLVSVWKNNIPQVDKYIDAMLENDECPRDVELCLEVIAQKKSNLLLQSKLGPALARKIQELQKQFEPKDPAKVLKNCKRVYEQFKTKGYIIWDPTSGEKVTDEQVIIQRFKEMMGLSEEEIASIVKGE